MATLYNVKGVFIIDGSTKYMIESVEKIKFKNVVNDKVKFNVINNDLNDYYDNSDNNDYEYNIDMIMPPRMIEKPIQYSKKFKEDLDNELKDIEKMIVKV
jgi:hypothetical protein